MRYAEIAPDSSKANFIGAPHEELSAVDADMKERMAAKKLQLDNLHLSVKLKRCRKGMPYNQHWERAWNEYKRWALKNFIERNS